MNDYEKLSETLREDSATTYFESGGETVREGEPGDVGTHFGTLENFRGYRVVEHLSSFGAESDIHLVEREGARYILKLYRRGIEPKVEVLRRLENLSREHPKELVRIFETDFDEQSGRWYEIQEYAQLGTLKDILAKRKRGCKSGPRTFFNGVLREIADSLAVLHYNNILHLDLKPGNVLVRSTKPLDLVLTDFGVASLLDPELTKKFTASRGTPMYQSPESIAGNMGRASDWWGLGMLALEIASGAHPFEGLAPPAIFGILTTKSVEIPESLSEDCRELLRGLLTRDMKKRWGLDQVNRWLAGERGIPNFYELPAEEPAGRRAVRPFYFMESEYHEIDSLATACARDEVAWNKGKAFLLRGNIRMWLEGEGEYEQAVDIDALIEKVQDENDKMFYFVHTYGKSLPLSFMGKPLTPANLFLFAGKSARKEKMSEAESIIAKKLLDGSLSPLIDCYSGVHGRTHTLDDMRKIVASLKGKSAEDAFQTLHAILHIEEYYCPFLGDAPTVDSLVDAFSVIGGVPWTKERWEGFSREYICPEFVVEETRRSAEGYRNALSELEALAGRELLIPWKSVSADTGARIAQESREEYEKAAYSILWGYNDKVTALLENVSNVIYKALPTNDQLESARLQVFRQYCDLFIGRSRMVEDIDKELLELVRQALYSKESDGSSIVSLLISRLLTISSDSHVKQAIEQYEAELRSHKQRIQEREDALRKEREARAEKRRIARAAFIQRLLSVLRFIYLLLESLFVLIISFFGALLRFLGPVLFPLFIIALVVGTIGLGFYLFMQIGSWLVDTIIDIVWFILTLPFRIGSWLVATIIDIALFILTLPFRIIKGIFS